MGYFCIGGKEEEGNLSEEDQNQTERGNFAWLVVIRDMTREWRQDSLHDWHRKQDATDYCCGKFLHCGKIETDEKSRAAHAKVIGEISKNREGKESIFFEDM